MTATSTDAPSGSETMPTRHPRVTARLAQHVDEQVARAVGHRRMLGEARGARDVHRHLCDAGERLERSRARRAVPRAPAGRPGVRPRHPRRRSPSPRSPPRVPGCSTTPSIMGTWPATKASDPLTRTAGTRRPRFGGGGSSRPSSERRARIAASSMPLGSWQVSVSAARGHARAAGGGVPSRSGRPRCRGPRGSRARTRGMSSRTGQRMQKDLATASRAFFCSRRSK